MKPSPVSIYETPESRTDNREDGEVVFQPTRGRWLGPFAPPPISPGQQIAFLEDRKARADKALDRMAEGDDPMDEDRRKRLEREVDYCLRQIGRVKRGEALNDTLVQIARAGQPPVPGSPEDKEHTARRVLESCRCGAMDYDVAVEMLVMECRWAYEDAVRALVGIARSAAE